MRLAPGRHTRHRPPRIAVHWCMFTTLLPSIFFVQSSPTSQVVAGCGSTVSHLWESNSAGIMHFREPMTQNWALDTYFVSTC